MKLLSSGGAYIKVSKGGDVYRIDDYESHGMAMWAAWTFGAIIEVGTNRYLKHYAPYHQYVHSIVGIAIVAITIFSSMEMMEQSGDKHIHNILGIVTMSIAIILLVTGLTLGIVANFCDLSWKIDFTRVFRKAHKLLGMFVTLLSLVTIASGIFVYA